MVVINKVYLDMDGVLADFERSFKAKHGMLCQDFEDKYGEREFWEAVYRDPYFFKTMQPMPMFREVVVMCQNLVPDDKVTILSSPSRVNTSLCIAQKREWLDMFVGYGFPAIFEREKHKYAAMGNLLVDDHEGKCEKWIEAGGIAHHYTDFDNFKNYITTMGILR